MDTLM